MANPLHDRLFAPHTGRHDPFLYLPGDTVLTFGAFDALASQFAHVLSEHAAPGDRIAVQVAKSPAALALYAACVRTATILVPLNPTYTAPEAAYFIEDSGATVLICDPGAPDVDGPNVDGPVRLTLDDAGRGTLTDHAATYPATFDAVPRGTDDLAALLYTSGTTGRSKGAMLTQGNLLSNAVTLADLWGFTNHDVLLHALPIFHTHGLFVASNVMLAAGGSMIWLPRFDVDAVIDALPRATAMMGVPTFYTRLLADPRLTRAVTSRLRLFVSGSAPLLDETHRRFEARTGHAILERYGMTETNMNTSNPLNGPRRPGTVGLPLPDVALRIADPATGAILPQGEIGGIEVRGPNVCQGYWNRPDKTAESFRADGYFITGDLGLIDADGYVQIVGRDKDLIISGGLNVYPKEVEAALDALPGIVESAVIGVPHPDLGEAVLAVIVADGTLDGDAVNAALGRTLARYKQPRALEVIEALPRNAMGKVQKAALRAQFAAAFTA